MIGIEKNIKTGFVKLISLMTPSLDEFKGKNLPSRVKGPSHFASTKRK